MSRRHHPRGRFSRAFRLLELESRITPAIISTFDEPTGLFSVTSDGADSITIGTDQFSRVTVNGTNFVSSLGTTIDAAQVRAINVTGGPGNNAIDLSDVVPETFDLAEIMIGIGLAGGLSLELAQLSRTAPITINGGAGADTITGSEFSDLIAAFSGADVIEGNDGDDVIWLRNDDFSPVTVYGGWGYNELIVDYVRQVGAIQEVTADIYTGSSTISYGLKQCVEKDTAVRLADQDYNALTLINSSPLPGGAGGTVDVRRRTAGTRVVFARSDESAFKYIEWSPKLEGGKEGLAVTLGSNVNGYAISVDSSEAPVSIDSTVGGNSLTVNTHGLSSSMTPSSVQVAGMAPITFTGMSAVSTETLLYDEVAIAELKSKGITLTPSVVTNIDGTTTLGLQITNSGTATFDDPQIHWSNNTRDSVRQDFGQSKVRRPRDLSTSFIQTMPSPGTTVVVVDDAASQPRRAPAAVARAAGLRRAAFYALPDVGPGTSPVNSIKAGHYAVSNFRVVVEGVVAGKKVRIELKEEFQNGDIPEQNDFADTIDSFGNTPSGGPTGLLGTDATGRVTLVLSSATNIYPSEILAQPEPHLYVRGMRVDVSPSGAAGNGAPGQAEMSLDGRFVVFESTATNLVAGLIDTNGAKDVFLRDMLLGQTYCLSQNGGHTGNGESFDPHISWDGRSVVYRSLATNLVTGVIDNNSEPDLYEVHPVFGLKTEWINSISQCVSLVPLTSQTCNKGVDAVDLNGDAFGDFMIAYVTKATDTGAGTAPGTYVLGVNGKVEAFRIKQNIITVPIGKELIRVSMDGSTVVFFTDADISTLLPPGVVDGNGARDIITISADSNVVTCVSLNHSKTATADGPSPAYAGEAPAVSVDGSVIAFNSMSSNLISGLVAPATDGLYRWVRDSSIPSTPVITRFDTIGSSSWGADNHSPSISADGRTVAWTSKTDYKSGGPAYGTIQSWVKKCYDGDDARDRPTVHISVTPTDGASQGTAINSRISPDGELVLYTSNGNDIVPGDNNGQPDVFASRRGTEYKFTLTVSDPLDVTVAYDSLSNSIVLKNSGGVVFASQAANRASGKAVVFLRLRDSTNDTVTLDMASLQRLGGEIIIHGGTGTDQVTVKGAPGETMETGIVGGAGGTASVYMWRDLGDGGFLADRELMSASASIVMSGVEEVVDDTKSERLVLRMTASTTTAVVSGGNVQVQSGSFKVSSTVTPLVQNERQTIMVLNPGNDTCSVDFTALPVDAIPNLVIIGNGGDDSISAKYGLAGQAFVLDGTRSQDDGLIQGSAGHDTIFVGPGVANGGNGNDHYSVPVPRQSGDIIVDYTLFDADGIETIDFSDAGGPVTMNLDSTATQAITTGSTLQLSGTFENAVGSSFDDTFTIKLGSTPRSIDGGDNVTLDGDTLIVDAQGKATTAFEGKVASAFFQTAVYRGVEDLQIINNAPTLQVAAIEINEGDMQRSKVNKIVVGFNSLVTFPNGASAAFKITNNSNGDNVVCTPIADDGYGFTHVVITFAAGAPDYGSLPNGAFTLHVLASEVASAMGPLDGNGDGAILPGGENYASPSTLIFRTFGDFNGDRTSNLIDFAEFRDAFNVGPSDIFDAEGDGAVGLLDFAIFRLRFNILV